MFDWYVDMSKGGRIGIALFILAIAGISLVCGYFWPWGWAIGGVLLVAAFVIRD